MSIERAARKKKIVAVVPALNEERAIRRVVRGLFGHGINEVVVVDNGSVDRTGERARAAGAQVVQEPVRGYGRACLAGIAAADLLRPDIVVFADGDGADVLDDLPALLAPLAEGIADLVIGSRMTAVVGQCPLPLHVRWGNRFATLLLRLLLGARYTDLGPLRAIRYPALRKLRMQDPAFGWTVEMQIRAILEGLAIAEVPVRYQARQGRSKISGTAKGSLRAGAGILTTIFRLAVRGQRASRS